MSYICRPCLLLTVCGVSLACGADKDRVFGPEWIKDGEYMKKKMEIVASHRVNAKNSVVSYDIGLEKHRLWAIESDDGFFCGSGVVLSKDHSFAIETRKNAKGEVYQLRSVSNYVTYFDFDRDGIYDAYIDNRGSKNDFMIRVDDTYVRVRESKDAFGYHSGDKGPPPKISYDGKKTYKFEDGKWAEK